jgi:hypothetical protein
MRPIKRSGLLLIEFVGVLAVATGCSEAAKVDASPGPAFSVRDSAGIRIVDHGDVSSRMAPFKLADAPDYRVGWNPGEVEWSDVIWGVFLSGGRVAIADRIASTIVVLGPDGTLESSFGASGQGPGEFRGLKTMTVVGQDTIAAQDFDRITLIHSDSLLRTLPARGLPIRVIGEDGEGNILLGGTPSIWDPGFPEPWSQVPLVRMSLATGAMDTVATADFAQNFEGRSGPGGRCAMPVTPCNEFAAWGYSTGWRGGFIKGRGNTSALTWLNLEGEVTQIVRWTAPDIPLTDDVWEAYADWLRSRGVTAAGIAEFKASAAGPLPIFKGLLSDQDGNAWMADFAGENTGFPHRTPRYRVVSAQGEFLGSVDMPPQFSILRIARDYVLGIERNSFDVAAVTLYRIER